MIVTATVLAILQAVTAQPPAPPRCSGAEYEALDFWVGDWDVTPAKASKPTARSKIEKLYGGCAIRENWMPQSGASGGSLTGYDPATKRWSQTWIGSAPGPVYFVGGPVGDTMVLTGWWPRSGPKGEDGLTRMTYSRLEAGAVRQHGEFSADHGLTWQTTFDFIYRPLTGETP